MRKLFVSFLIRKDSTKIVDTKIEKCLIYLDNGGVDLEDFDQHIVNKKLMYESLLNQHRNVSNQIGEIKGRNFELTEEDKREIEKLEKRLVEKKKVYIDQVKKEKVVTGPKKEEGVSLNFLPVFDKDIFDDVASAHELVHDEQHVTNVDSNCTLQLWFVCNVSAHSFPVTVECNTNHVSVCVQYRASAVSSGDV